MGRYAQGRRRPRRRRPPCRLCRRHEEPVPPPLLSSWSPAAAEAQREAGREAQRRTPAAIAGTRTRGDRAAASPTYRAQRPHRGPRHRHPLDGFLVWVPLHAWNSVDQRRQHPAGDRPADTSGYNYLLVGSDSREGLTAGAAAGARAGGAPRASAPTRSCSCTSPRAAASRSWSRSPATPTSPIPGHGSNKINAAYRDRRSQAADPDRRAGHRHPRRRLRRDRLRRVRRRRRQPRRRRPLRAARHEGPEGRASTSRRAARPSTARTPSATCAPATTTRSATSAGPSASASSSARS